jgi:hypothetical protein
MLHYVTVVLIIKKNIYIFANINYTEPIEVYLLLTIKLVKSQILPSTNISVLCAIVFNIFIKFSEKNFLR